MVGVPGESRESLWTQGEFVTEIVKAEIICERRESLRKQREFVKAERVAATGRESR